MDSNADERDQTARALLDRYHASAPQPPVALDEAIRAAAREAVAAGGEDVSDALSAEQEASRYTSPPPWAALAAAMTMVALLLPALLREPSVPLAMQAVAPAAPAAGEGADAMVAVNSPRALGGVALADPSQEALPEPTPFASQALLAQKASRPGEQADGEREAQGLILDTAPSRAAGLREETLALGQQFLRRTRRSQETDELDASASLADVADAGRAPALQQRLEGRFRPDTAQADQLSVQLLDDVVLLQGDWSAQGAACNPLLALDRRPGESAVVSVERIAGRSPEDFVFLRLESESRVRLVHCTEDGWVVSAR